MYRLNRPTVATAFLLAPLFAGCSVGPEYEAHPPQVADQWHEDAELGLQHGDADVAQWWESFEDPTLTALIDRANTGNLDLRMAILRIRQARALRGIAAGALLPTLSGNSSFQRTKPSYAGFAGLGGGGSRADQFNSTVQRGVATSAVAGALTNAAPGAAPVAAPLANGLVGLIPNPSNPSGAPSSTCSLRGLRRRLGT